MSFFYEVSDLREIPVVNGISMKTMDSEESSIAFVDFPPLSHVQLHHHESEQLGIVLEGEVEYTIGDETKICREGSMFVVPPNTPHAVMVTTERHARVLEIFTPKRELHRPLNYVK